MFNVTFGIFISHMNKYAHIYIIYTHIHTQGDEPERIAEIFTAMWTTDLRDASSPDKALDTVEAVTEFIETKVG